MRMGEEFGWKGGTEQNFDQKNKNESEKQCKIYNFFYLLNNQWQILNIIQKNLLLNNTHMQCDN